MVDRKKQFELNRKLEKLANESFALFLKKFKSNSDYSITILVSFYEKAINLLSGIILLHENNLDECAQALIRVLFETYLKCRHYSFLRTEDPGSAVEKIIFSLIIMKEKDVLEQDKSLNSDEFYSLLGDRTEIKKNYEEDEIKKIKKYGFSCMSIESLAKKYNKNVEYQIMFRNFSRNVHANDTVEYMLKYDKDLKHEFSERNEAAYDLTFRLCIEIVIDMDKTLSLGIQKNLDEILEEYNQQA